MIADGRRIHSNSEALGAIRRFTPFIAVLMERRRLHCGTHKNQQQLAAVFFKTMCASAVF
jgi:hypothetical protein